ncbi:PREDICTED: beta-defensin 116 [Miniopterus natalensis]|uniref:beta-defensin 116 n=1 Tax=Miniopterus natalensis TaxID=291302 RepID=UPI0007A70128|nr:PREDICTED: beta-defensin 116 [Miniopterus natalensis]
MKPYLMTISILLILVHKTPGELFLSYFGKSQKQWIPCQLYRGTCTNTCRKYEIQYLTCPNDQKCCLKFFVKRTSSSNTKEDSNFDSNLSVFTKT